MSVPRLESVEVARDTLGERAVIFGLAMLLALATLGQGGGHPLGMLGWHACLVCLLVFSASPISAITFG